MEEIFLNSDREKPKVQSVLLFTDGRATKGVTRKDAILAAMTEFQKAENVILFQYILNSIS